jgi:hypothetical protein
MQLGARRKLFIVNRIDADLFIAVINLARRPDRKREMEVLLKKHDLMATFIDAVDANQTIVDTRFGISNSLGANWLSHQKVHSEFLASGKSFCLVLEDDAIVLSQTSNLRGILTEFLDFMDEKTIGLLQIGHVGRFWPLEELRYIIHRQNAIWRGIRVVKNEFVGGAHAYITTKSFSSSLAGLNIPVARGSDTFFADLAKGTLGRNWEITRLRRPIFGQASRSIPGVVLDSDVVA